MSAVLAISLLAAVATNETVHVTDAQTGIGSWETRTRGVRLKLTQILPDQVRAFYTARGFDVDTAERLATGACVFQTEFGNESAPGPIEFRLKDWRARSAQGERPLKLAEDWLAEWRDRGLSDAARIAFRWALLPVEHRYAIGDWNMGMTTVALPLGSRFNLEFVWQVDGARHEARLTGVRCARE